MPPADHSTSPSTTPASPAAQGRRLRLRTLVLLFVALILIVPLSGLMVVLLYTPEVEREATENLQTIAKLKAEQLESWLRERRADGLVLMSSKTLAQRVDQWVAGSLPDVERSALRAYFTQYQQAYGSVGVVLVRQNGQVLLQTSDETAHADILAQQLQAMRAGEVQQSDLYLESNGHPHLQWLIPLGTPNPDNGRPRSLSDLSQTAPRLANHRSNWSA